MNVQFQPTTTGVKSEQLTINSNAYNAGNETFPVTPQLNLTGTGTSAAGQAQVAASIIRQYPDARQPGREIETYWAGGTFQSSPESRLPVQATLE